MDQVQPQPAKKQLLGKTGLAPLRLARLLGDLAGLPLADMFGNGHRGPPLSRRYSTVTRYPVPTPQLGVEVSTQRHAAALPANRAPTKAPTFGANKRVVA